MSTLFELRFRNQTDEANVHDIYVDENTTTMGMLLEAIVQECNGGQIMKIMWGGKMVPDLQNKDRLLGAVIQDLDTDGNFNKTSLMTVTFSYVGGCM
jgi:hypothetical protein